MKVKLRIISILMITAFHFQETQKRLLRLLKVNVQCMKMELNTTLRSGVFSFVAHVSLCGSSTMLK